MTTARTLLIIPCYNEADSIRVLLIEIARLNLGYDTLVIDDGSNDHTADVARALSPVVQMVSNLGIGGCVQTGIKYAWNKGYDYCIQVDGDGQHPPKELAKLVAQKNTADIIIGSRFENIISFKSTTMRRFGSRLIMLTLFALFGGKLISDPTSGMRHMNRRAMELFARDYPQDFPEPISIARALKCGLTVNVVAVQMRERLNGVSSLKGLRKSISYMVRVLAYILLACVQKPPVSLSKIDEVNND